MNMCLGWPQIGGRSMVADALSILEWLWFLPSDLLLALIHNFPSFAASFGLEHLGCRDLATSLLSLVIWVVMFAIWRSS